MKKEKKDHFPNVYDRAIYDLSQLKNELSNKLERLIKNKDKHNEILIVFKDRQGNKCEARCYRDIQDVYACEGITIRKFDRLASELEDKQKYLQHSIQIPQIEDEIKMINGIIKDVHEAKEKRWPLY